MFAGGCQLASGSEQKTVHSLTQPTGRLPLTVPLTGPQAAP